MHAADIDLPYGTAYSYLVVGMLTLAYILSFADRMLLAMMIDPVRASLHLSDTQISLLLGLAFATFYALLSIPLGRLSDTGRRVDLLAAGVAVWSLATAGCGLASSAWQLFVARLGVGAGEATLSPAGYSLIADYFPPGKVGTAMSIYGTGITLGAGAAVALSGAIVGWIDPSSILSIPLFGEIAGWQAAFLMLGIPCLGFAILVRLVIREPTRRGSAVGSSAPSVTEVVYFIWRHRDAFLPILFGYATLSIVNYGVSSWAATFFLRVHSWSPATLGMVYGAILGLGGTFGVVAGGVIADRLVRGGREHGSALVVLGSMALQAPLFLVAFLIRDPSASMVAFGIAVTISGAAIGLQNVTLQNMTPNQMRGVMTGLFLMLANILGLAIGPTVIAATSDQFFEGRHALGYALATTVAICLPLAAGMVIAGLTPARRMLALQFHAFTDTRQSSLLVEPVTPDPASPSHIKEARNAR